MQKIRQTIINDYYLCGYKALQGWGEVGEAGKYEEEDSPQNKYSATGIALHEAMEHWGNHKIANSVREKEYYHLYLDHCIDANCPLELFEQGERDSFVISLHDQLDWLFDNADSNEILQTEWTFEVTGLFDGVDEPITGTVDRIDGDLNAQRVALIDYKSGKTFTKKKLSTNVQAMFYALAFNKEFGFLPEKFVFVFSKHKKKQIIWITPDFLQNAAAEFLGAYFKMKNNEFPTSCTNKFFCKNFCDVYKECPKYKRKNNAWLIEQESFNPNSNL